MANFISVFEYWAWQRRWEAANYWLDPPSEMCVAMNEAGKKGMVFTLEDIASLLLDGAPCEFLP